MSIIRTVVTLVISTIAGLLILGALVATVIETSIEHEASRGVVTVYAHGSTPTEYQHDCYSRGGDFATVRLISLRRGLQWVCVKKDDI